MIGEYLFFILVVPFLLLSVVALVVFAFFKRGLALECEGECFNDHALRGVWRYLDSEKTDYAIMLVGEWGSGKTFFVKNLISDDDRFCYVSCYGVSSIEELNYRIISSVYPKIFNRYTKAIGGVISNNLKLKWSEEEVGGELGVDFDGSLLGEVVSRINGKTIIFDDVERMGVSVGGFLSYINGLVEHGGQKCILVGDDKKIGSMSHAVEDEKVRFNTTREKTIARVYAISPDHEKAIESFGDDVKSEIFLSNKKEILNVFFRVYLASESKNLRVFRNAVRALDWFFEDLKFSVPDNIVTRMADIFVILYSAEMLGVFENNGVRFGDIDPYYSLYREDPDKESVIKVSKLIYDKFGMPLDGTILDLSLWESIVKGREFLLGEVESQISQGLEVEAGNNKPVWYDLWHYRTMDSGVFDSKLSDLLDYLRGDDFDSHKDIEISVSVLISLKDNGLLDLDDADILCLGDRAIDCYFSSIGDLSLDSMDSFDRYTHAGYVYHLKGDSRIREFVESVDSKRIEFVLGVAEEKKSKALDFMEGSYQDFLLFLNAQIDYGFSWHSPFMSLIDVDYFLILISENNQSERFAFVSAFGERLNKLKFSDDVPGSYEKEFEWAVELQKGAELYSRGNALLNYQMKLIGMKIKKDILSR